MKKLLYIATIALAAACSGQIDPEGEQTVEIPDEYTAPFTLSVDKTEVEASGQDYVTFSLKDKYDRDILQDKKALQSVNIVSEEGQRVPRMDTRTRFISNGTYHFSATFKGQDCENVIEIVAKNRAAYEKFHKNVAIYKATATWCGPCAYMTRALERMNEDTKNHSVELCWHYQDDLAINSPGTSYDCGTMIASMYGSGGVPTVVLDLVTPVVEKASSALETAAWDLRAEFPATCGIKLSSAYDAETGMIDINAELTSSTGGEYDLGFAILLNDQVIPSGTNDDGKYSHIVRAATGNYYMYSTAIQSVEKDGKLSFSQSVASSGDVSDLSVVAFALVKHTEAARIDNIVEAKVGETIDYVYNE